eukprot:GFUD01120210.1.p1 GENE.GFUD01120210.1~~GFUD01120210.1.p1  ORF type:complete len:178 (+),score=55.36 GFUD01120210.1:56-535(+)
MSHPTARSSAQSRLLPKVSTAPPLVRPGHSPRLTADPVLAGIVARLKAEVKSVPEQGQKLTIPQAKPDQTVYDPFSRYHNQNKMTPQPRVDMSSTTCICHRPRQLVMCQHCGETFEGRVNRTCPTHPSVTYLLDVVACIGCKMSNLEDLKEFPVMIKNK